MHDELTAMDIAKMKEEIEHRTKVLRPQLLAEVKRTREYGDLSENYEYKAAKQEKNRNESRIRYLQAMIDTAIIIEKSGTEDTVGLFDRVTVYIPMLKKEQVWQITTTLRVDVLSGIISKESPLGKAEWLVAISEIVGCRERGVAEFREVVERYEAVKANVSRGGNAPKVMFNLPYQDVWYMPSDESYMVQLVEDAGGEYIYKGKNTTRGSVAINLEEAYLLVADADVWLNVGQCSTMEELRSAAPHFMTTSVVERGEVYNNNRRRTAAGGSDFWESAIVRPDVVLAELAAIMSGEAVEPCYYQQLQ
jgi:transcription elongation GreA/GreB family factor